MNNRDTFTFRLCAALWAVLGLICLVSTSAMAWDQNPQGKCVDPRGCEPGPSPSPSPGYSPPTYNDDAERRERNARYDKLLESAQTAWKRHDYREALRLFRKLLTLRDGPNMRDNIVKAEALIAWQEAKTAADYRRAMAMRPGIFTQDNVRYVEQLEAKEKYERERQEREAQWERDRIKREAEDVRAATLMRERISTFAASLDTDPPEPGIVVSHGGTRRDAMGTRQADAPLEFGDPNAPEARSEQARQGFDKAGPLMGSASVPSGNVDKTGHSPVLSSALAAQVPDKAKNDPVIRQSLAWYHHLDSLKAETAQQISTVKARLQERSGDPGVLAAQLSTLTNQMTQIDTDQTKATEAVKDQVKNLGLEWIESPAPMTPERKPK